MRVVWVFVVLLIVTASIGISVKSYQNAENATGGLDQERYLRMSAEEDLHSAKQKIKTLETQLTTEKAKAQKAEAMTQDLRDINKDLQARLKKAADLQGKLESKIKEIESLSSTLQQ